MNWGDYLLGVSQNIVAGALAVGGGWFAHHKWVRPVLREMGQLLEQIGAEPDAQEGGSKVEDRSQEEGLR